MMYYVYIYIYIVGGIFQARVRCWEFFFICFYFSERNKWQEMTLCILSVIFHSELIETSSAPLDPCLSGFKLVPPTIHYIYICLYDTHTHTLRGQKTVPSKHKFHSPRTKCNILVAHQAEHGLSLECRCLQVPFHKYLRKQLFQSQNCIQYSCLHSPALFS